jgi:hypothetical protein
LFHSGNGETPVGTAPQARSFQILWQCFCPLLQQFIESLLNLIAVEFTQQIHQGFGSHVGDGDQLGHIRDDRWGT